MYKRKEGTKNSNQQKMIKAKRALLRNNLAVKILCQPIKRPLEQELPCASCKLYPRPSSSSGEGRTTALLPPHKATRDPLAPLTKDPLAPPTRWGSLKGPANDRLQPNGPLLERRLLGERTLEVLLQRAYEWCRALAHPGRLLLYKIAYYIYINNIYIVYIPNI